MGEAKYPEQFSEARLESKVGADSEQVYDGL